MNEPSPSDHPDSELDQLLSRLVEQDLSEPDEKRLAERLREEKTSRAHYLRYLELHGALHWDYADAASALPDSAVPAKNDAPRRNWLPALAAAAALVCFGLLVIQSRSEPTLVEVQFAEGAVSGSPHVTNVTNLLEPGDRLAAGTIYVESVTGSAQLLYDDGTLVTLSGESELSLSAPSSGKNLQLRRGRLTANVAPQPPGAPLSIVTPTAELKVVGTILSLSADASETGLAVDEGRVILKRLADGREIEVPASHQASASLDSRSDLSLRRQNTPFTTWHLDPDEPEFSITKGTRIGPHLQAEPYVAAQQHDGTKVIRHGVAINGRLVRLTATSQVHLRFRSQSAPSVFISRAENDGQFGGNFEIKIPVDDLSQDEGGWVETRLAVADFLPLTRTTGREGRPSSGEIRKLLISVRAGQELELAGITVTSD